MKKRDNVRVCVPRFLQIGRGSLNELPDILKTIGNISSLPIYPFKMLLAPNLIEDKGLLNKFIGIYYVIKYNV